MEPVVSQSNTVCIGIEFAWWGGQGRGSSASCADVIVGQQASSSRPWYRVVDLRCAPNPLAHDSCQPNYDADAAIVTACLRKELDQLEQSGANRFILAIDAPLATIQVGHPARRRVLKKGDQGGVSRRSCECQLMETVKRIGGPWRQAVNVQPGAPLAPRVSRFMERLTGELGFIRWDGADCQRELPARVLIEVLPIEAIWALGIIGAFGDNGPELVGRYRKCERFLVSRDDAITWAKWPLNGFLHLLEDQPIVPAIADAIAGWACEGRMTDGSLKIAKRYSSLVDAGIALLTAVSFRHGKYHTCVSADLDGCIVGPGTLPLVYGEPVGGVG